MAWMPRKTAAIVAALSLPGILSTVATRAHATPSAPPVTFPTGLQLQAGPMQVSSTLRIAPATALPASVDLTRWALPAGNQGQVSSCVSWAIDYEAMGWYEQHDGVTGGRLAPMYTYAQLVHGQNVGTFFSDTFAIAQNQGVDNITDYTPGDYDYTTQPSAAQVRHAATWKLSGYDNLPIMQGSTTQGAIETSLAASKPVVLGIPVYYNFFQLNSNNDVYTATSGAFQGYHAVTALGYDATGVRIENSWGTSWGKNGFATLSWSFVNTGAIGAYSVKPLVAAAPTPAAPTVTAVAPAAGSLSGGSLVTITGTGFTSGAVVKFDSATAAGVVVNSATQITARTPAHAAGVASVAVTTAGGTSAASNNAAFRYEGSPTVGSVSNRTGSPSGGNTITVNGSNFYGASVTIATKAATSSVDAQGQTLAVTVPSGAAGTAAISIATPVGSVSAGSYTYASAPTVTSVAPTAGNVSGNTSVTITGTGFVTGAVVKFDTVTAPNVVVNSPTQIIARSPVHAAGVASVTVTTVGGTSAASGGAAFRYEAAPSVSSVSSRTGDARGGTSITINGNNFYGASVTFGTATAASSVDSQGRALTVTVPASTAGTVAISVLTPVGSVSAGTYTYTARPTVSSISPTTGTKNGGTQVTIRGTNLAGGTVTISGHDARIVSTSSTSIVAMTPAGTSGSVGAIVVTTSGGSINAATYAYLRT